jgi:hypothetical protein
MSAFGISREFIGKLSVIEFGGCIHRRRVSVSGLGRFGEN